MKQKILLILIFLIFILPEQTIASAPKVTILEITAPTKVYDMETFSVKASILTSESGGMIRTVLRSNGEELGSSQSGPVIAFPNPVTINLTISDVRLTAQETPKLELDAYWIAVLGGETKEESRIIPIEVIEISFDVEYLPRAVLTNESFDLTYTITNKGNDKAYAVETELVSLAGFAAESPTQISMGEIGPSEIKNATFKLSSSITDIFGGARTLALVIRFKDWKGIVHQQNLDIQISLKVSEKTVEFWLPYVVLFAIAIGIFLFILLKAYAIKIDLGSVTIRKKK